MHVKHSPLLGRECAGELEIVSAPAVRIFIDRSFAPVDDTGSELSGLGRDGGVVWNQRVCVSVVSAAIGQLQRLQLPDQSLQRKRQNKVRALPPNGLHLLYILLTVLFKQHLGISGKCS